MPIPAMTASYLSSIPSPSFESIQIGPLTLRMYGLAIAMGVIAAVTISSRRWEARGGHPDDISTIAIWAIPAGVIGTRIYHVATDWKHYQDDWLSAFNITQGGLGIPGGIFFGVLAGYIVTRVRRLPPRPLLDVVAPAIPVAQAIGRLGNWFNQELFGHPTDVPWGLEIDPEIAEAAGHSGDQTFHPTFLYEGLWNVALALVLIRIDRTRKLRPGQLFCLYLGGYAVGRFWVELMRSDQASLIFDVRVNTWMSSIVLVGAVIAFAMLQRGAHPGPEAHLAPAAPAPDDAQALQSTPSDDVPEDGEVDEDVDDAEDAEVAEDVDRS